MLRDGTTQNMPQDDLDPETEQCGKSWGSIQIPRRSDLEVRDGAIFRHENAAIITPREGALF